MQFSSYLSFDGKCREAFQFYAECLGGRIEAMIPIAGSPMEEHAAPETRDRIMHARLNAGGATLMGGDAPVGGYKPPTGFSVQVEIADAQEGERIFKALGQGGAIQLPFQKTFWASGFGMLVDRYGIPWMVNCA